MEAKQIAVVGRELGSFLGEFRDSFGCSEPREHLEMCVRGQVSDLPHKNVETISMAAVTRPRTLQ